MKNNNYAFIDAQNLHLAIRDQGWKLDYGRFRVYLKDKYQVSKAFLFLGYLPTNQDLYKVLQQQGYVLVFKPVLQLAKGRVKGNVDAELVLHAMIEYPHYDQAVLVTGDGDFHCLVKHLKNKKRLKKLLIPNQKKYSFLFNEFIPQDTAFISGLKKKLKYR